jgi:hypothetical protein
MLGYTNLDGCVSIYHDIHVLEDHVWFENRWMVASWCDE